MIPNLNSIYSKRVEKKHRLGMDHSDVCLGTEFPPIQGDWFEQIMIDLISTLPETNIAHENHHLSW